VESSSGGQDKSASRVKRHAADTSLIVRAKLERPKAATRRRLAVAALAICSLAVYVAFAFLLETSGSHQHHLDNRTVLAPGLVLLALLYWLGYRQVRDAGPDPVTTRIVIAAAVAFAVACVLTAPFDSLDLFVYVNRGWLQYGYGLNPYSHTIDEVRRWTNDPMFTGLWVSNPSPHGFLFAQLEWLACKICGGNLARLFVFFKVINLAAGALTAVLIFSTAKALGIRRPDLALFLYLWNPLLLLQEVANGHNDILMAMFVVLALALTVADLWALAVLALTAAFLIKYVPVLLIPLALVITLRRKGFAQLLAASLGIILLVWAIAGTYLADFRHFKLFAIATNLAVSCNSVQALLATLFGYLAQVVPALGYSSKNIDLASTCLTWGIALVLAGAIFFRLAANARPSARLFISAALSIEILMVCLASSKFFAWYPCMFFPMALLLEEHKWLREFTVALSIFELPHFTALQDLPTLTFLVATGIPILIATWRSRRQSEQASAEAAYQLLSAKAVPLGSLGD
jgi:hypothetical protein